MCATCDRGTGKSPSYYQAPTKRCEACEGLGRGVWVLLSLALMVAMGVYWKVRKDAAAAKEAREVEEAEAKATEAAVTDVATAFDGNDGAGGGAQHGKAPLKRLPTQERQRVINKWLLYKDIYSEKIAEKVRFFFALIVCSLP